MSPVTRLRFNDATMEIVTALSRGLAILAAFGLIAAIFFSIWTADVRWLFTLLTCLACGVAFGWLGFRTLGNAEWFKGGR